MTALLVVAILLTGAFIVALALNVSADHREAERARRHRDALRRMGGRRDHGGWS